LDSLLGYILFLVPGFIIILINERIGFHPAAKYTNVEKSIMSVIFSIPVLISNLLFLAFRNGTLGAANITVLQEEIKSASGLLWYSLVSLLSAYIVCCIWHEYIKSAVVQFVNQIRNLEGRSSLSNGLVWEDAFHGKESQAVMVILKDEKLFGSPINASENISDERCLLLAHSKEVEDIVTKYNIPVNSIYIDAKSGMAIKIYDSEKFRAALKLHEKYCNNEPDSGLNQVEISKYHI